MSRQPESQKPWNPCDIRTQFFSPCGHPTTSTFCRNPLRLQHGFAEEACDDSCITHSTPPIILTHVKCPACRGTYRQQPPPLPILCQKKLDALRAYWVARRNFLVSTRPMRRAMYERMRVAAEARWEADRLGRVKARHDAWVESVKQRREQEDAAGVPMEQREYYFDLDDSIILKPLVVISAAVKQEWMDGSAIDEDLIYCSICSIVKEKLDARRIVKCGHVFHIACLREWLESGVSRTCPICRAPVNVHEVPDFEKE